MTRNYRVKKSLTPAQVRRAPTENTTGAARKGFQDAQSGASYRNEYETATRAWQRNYELGRLAFAYASRAGMSRRALAWPASTVLPRFMDSLVNSVMVDLKRMREGV